MAKQLMLWHKLLKWGMYLFSTAKPVSQSFLWKKERFPHLMLKVKKAGQHSLFQLSPPPFVRQKYTEKDLPNISQESHDYAIRKLDSARNEGIFTPLSFEGTIVFPGFRGGGEWSGASFDFETGILYVNANEIPNLVSLRKLPNSESSQTTISPGEKLYQLNCALCHGPELQGREKFPALSMLINE